MVYCHKYYGSREVELKETHYVHVNAACDPASQSFRGGEQSGHHGRRRLLNLLLERTISFKGK